MSEHHALDRIQQITEQMYLKQVVQAIEQAIVQERIQGHELNGLSPVMVEEQPDDSSPRQNDQIQRAHKARSPLAQALNKQDITGGQSIRSEGAHTQPGTHLTDYGVLVNSNTLAEETSSEKWQVVKKNNKTQGVVTRAQSKASNNTWADEVEEEQIAEQSIPITRKIQGDPSTQEWKNNKTKGVVTRSQTMNANRAGKVEDAQVVDQSPISTKVQAGNKATNSRKQLERQMCKLGSRLNKISSTHGMRSQLLAEMAGLQEEYSLLR